jgi:hypothetical protein
MKNPSRRLAFRTALCAAEKIDHHVGSSANRLK